MKLIECSGTPTERGLAHGETLRDGIAAALGAWAEATLPGSGLPSPGAYAERLLGRTGLMAAAARHTPDLVEEVAGIARAAGQPFELVAAYNLMDEQWWFDGAEDAPPPGCSLVALPAEDGHVLAQIMDLPVHMDGSQVALALSGPDMPRTIVLSAAGMVGLTGLNAAGVAVGVNTLLMLHHDAGGLPVAFALRHALRADSAGDAARRLAGVPHASGQHYAAVDRTGIVALECSAGGCVAVSGQGGRLTHANHPLASPDVDPGAQDRLARTGWAASSRTRQDWLEREVRDLEVADAVQALFDDAGAPICLKSGEGASFTFASVLYELGGAPRARMRAGPAGGAEWTRFGMEAA